MTTAFVKEQFVQTIIFFYSSSNATLIPYDIILHILKFCTNEELLVVLNINKSFKLILLSHETLWKHPTENESDNNIEFALDGARNNQRLGNQFTPLHKLTSLAFRSTSSLCSLAKKRFVDSVSYFPSKDKNWISMLSFMSTAVRRLEISFETMASEYNAVKDTYLVPTILKHAPLLESLVVYITTGLTTVYKRPDENYGYYSKLVPAIKCQQSLHLVEFRYILIGSVVEYHDPPGLQNDVGYVVRNAPNLKILEIPLYSPYGLKQLGLTNCVNWKRIEQFHSRSFDASIIPPSIQVLSCIFPYYGVNNLFTPLETFVNLRKLTILPYIQANTVHRVVSILADCVLTYLNKLPSLTELDLSDNYIQDEPVEVVLDQLKRGHSNPEKNTRKLAKVEREPAAAGSHLVG